ncbi:hypothetical protein BaRGS_00033149 [Batillaria attramentaria]|uniref:MAM domain-containing protein n=1 Tax=Batillaria attramentaria TaxID=370345 RepID=A0ABD0JLN9_9CAEN
MDEISCIDFMYAHELPTWLDVHLETDNGTIITLLESRENHPTGVVFSYTVFNTIAKIKFRARGGGNTRSPAAKLYYVSVGVGNCSAGPDCKFNPPDAYSRPVEIFCGWKPENWQTTGALSFRELQLRDASGIGKFVFVVRPHVMSSLTSNVMPPTGSDSPACLEFAYVVTGVNARLTVSVEPLGLSGGLTTLWNVASNTFNSSTDWSFAAVAVLSSKVFKIRFGSSPATDDFAVIAIDNITYTRKKPNNCETIPETKKGEEGENFMVVVGAVTAVLLVTVVIVIVGIVLWRRRPRGDSDHLELNDAASRDIQTSSMETVDYQGTGQDTAEETDDYLVPCNALGLCNPAVNISALQLDK